MTLDAGPQEDPPPVPGPRLTDIPHPAVAQSLPLADLGGGVQEELVVSALVHTPGVLPAGLGQEGRREEDGGELRALQHDLESGGVGESVDQGQLVRPDVGEATVVPAESDSEGSCVSTSQLTG